jgi:hypothetical protein
MINEYTRDAFMFLGLVTGTFSTMMLARQLNQPYLFWTSLVALFIFAEFAIAHAIIGMSPKLLNKARLTKQIN